MLGDLTVPLLLVGALSLAGVALALILYARAVKQNRNLLEAIDNMSQGLCMFDAQTRIVVCNARYLECTNYCPTS